MPAEGGAERPPFTLRRRILARTVDRRGGEFAIDGVDGGLEAGGRQQRWSRRSRRRCPTRSSRRSGAGGFPPPIQYCISFLRSGQYCAVWALRAFFRRLTIDEEMPAEGGAERPPFTLRRRILARTVDRRGGEFAIDGVDGGVEAWGDNRDEAASSLEPAPLAEAASSLEPAPLAEAASSLEPAPLAEAAVAGARPAGRSRFVAGARPAGRSRLVAGARPAGRSRIVAGARPARWSPPRWQKPPRRWSPPRWQKPPRRWSPPRWQKPPRRWSPPRQKPPRRWSPPRWQKPPSYWSPSRWQSWSPPR